jgi:hypothetical protein
MSETTSQLGQASTSAWAPLRQPLFRALWIASVTSNIGTWMQNVGAAWLMTLLTPYPRGLRQRAGLQPPCRGVLRRP